MTDESSDSAISSETVVSVAFPYLREVLRSRVPGYVSDGSVVVRSTDAAAPVDSVKGGEIDRVLSGAIPPVAAYTSQRLYALNVICRNVGPDASDDRIRAVIAAIWDKRPLFPQSFSAKGDWTNKYPKIVSDLFNKLNKYSKIKSKDTKRFPYIEVLGHRRDDQDSQVRGKTFFQVMAGPPTEVKEINDLVDQLVPRGAYFNGVRQGVLEVILDNEKLVNGYYSDKEKLMGLIEEKVAPWRQELLRLPRQSRLEPSDVRKIAEMIRSAQCAIAEALPERALKRWRGGKGEVIAVRPTPIRKDSVPDGIKRAVSRQAPGRTDISDAVRTMAIRAADAMDALVLPARGNFNKRARLVEKILRQESTCNLTGKKGFQVDETSTGFQEFKQAIDSFRCAVSDELQTQRSIMQAGVPVAPRGPIKAKYSPLSRQANASDLASGAPAGADADGADTSSRRKRSFRQLEERPDDRSRKNIHSLG